MTGLLLCTGLLLLLLLLLLKSHISLVHNHRFEPGVQIDPIGLVEKVRTGLLLLLLLLLIPSPVTLQVARGLLMLIVGWCALLLLHRGRGVHATVAATAVPATGGRHVVSRRRCRGRRRGLLLLLLLLLAAAELQIELIVRVLAGNDRGRTGRNLPSVRDGRCEADALQRHLVDRCDLVRLEVVALYGRWCGVRAPIVRIEPDAGGLDVTVRPKVCNRSVATYLWLELERVQRCDSRGVLWNLLDELILPALGRVGLPGGIERHRGLQKDEKSRVAAGAPATISLIGSIPGNGGNYSGEEASLIAGAAQRLTRESQKVAASTSGVAGISARI
uniref:Secreted protein n=1 Tax=Anopheles farauti TaxID=69004 RepID=A0A182QD62_9DIPT